MNITYVAKNNNYERYKIFNLKTEKDNPFYETTKPGERISISVLGEFVASSPINATTRAIRRFIFDAILDKYQDIRYYYSQDKIYQKEVAFYNIY